MYYIDIKIHTLARRIFAYLRPNDFNFTTRSLWSVNENQFINYLRRLATQ